MRSRRFVFAGLILAMSAHAAPPSMSADAPELALPGAAAIGVREVTVVRHDEIDPLASIAAGRRIVADRSLRLLIWYPAKAAGEPMSYTATLTAQPPAPPKTFSLPSQAARDAAPLGERHPVVIISHGYSNDPAMMSWIGENLATKGFVSVAIAHRDPAYTERDKAIESILLRPLDIAHVTGKIRAGLLGSVADPNRIALLGYSMGGYGVLTAAGARLDPAEAPFHALPAHVLDAANAGDIKAVIAIAPGGKTPFSVWGKEGLAGVRAPLLVIAGEADRSVGYETGPAAVFNEAIS
jgi:predicted dienelactone hydrolase